jgi:ATP-binding cassette, subfamily F, member 3
MSIISAQKLTRSFGAEDIFWDISVSIPHGARIALVGPNGAGKTTLLRILIGADTPTAGTVHRARHLTIGYLPQEAEHAFQEESESLWAEMLAVFADLRRQEAALRRMEEQMAATGAPEELLTQYGAALERFEHEGGYEYELRIRQVLAGLGFARADWEMPIAHLSGGQKTRALLARLLLQAPQLLVMDEPTNHLDIEAIEWLEGQLINWPGALLIVSHDRYFLDRVVNRVWELNWGQIESYRGNYTAYAQQRVERTERRLAEYEAQQAYIAKEEDFIRRNIAGQRTKEAQGRLKRLERLKRDHLIHAPRHSRQLYLRFQDARRSGDIILQTTDLVVGYTPAAPLFRADDIDFRRTECAALIGPNGSGKTTFLKTILGELDPLGGRLRRGASLEVGYFAQAHDALDIKAGRTVLEELLHHHPMLTGEARDYLAKFLFTGDDVFKPLPALSGGERGRLALALLMRQRVNFLLLDEPTNHLDIPAQEVLEDVINDFDGTVILVSHDRYLVSRLASQIWTLEGDRLRVYKGPYEEYVAARARAAAEGADGAGGRKAAPRRPARESAEESGAREARQAAKRATELEESIHALEAELASLSGALQEASRRRAFDRIRHLTLQYHSVEAELEQRLAEWARVASSTYETE